MLSDDNIRHLFGPDSRDSAFHLAHGGLPSLVSHPLFPGGGTATLRLDETSYTGFTSPFQQHSLAMWIDCQPSSGDRDDLICRYRSVRVTLAELVDHLIAEYGED